MQGSARRKVTSADWTVSNGYTKKHPASSKYCPCIHFSTSIPQILSIFTFVGKETARGTDVQRSQVLVCVQTIRNHIRQLDEAHSYAWRRPSMAGLWVWQKWKEGKGRRFGRWGSYRVSSIFQITFCAVAVIWFFIFYRILPAILLCYCSLISCCFYICLE